jgi:hypothetical protein
MRAHRAVDREITEPWFAGRKPTFVVETTTP